MIAVRNKILNGRAGPAIDGTNPTGVFYLPTVRARAAVETAYTIYIEPVTGGPSAANIGFSFEAMIGTTGGGSQTPPTGVGVYAGNAGTRYYWSDLRPAFTRLNGIEHKDLLPDGDFRVSEASQTLASAIVIVKRIKGGFDHRLRINPSFTGGTNPGFPLSISYEVRY